MTSIGYWQQAWNFGSILEGALRRKQSAHVENLVIANATRCAKRRRGELGWGSAPNQPLHRSSSQGSLRSPGSHRTGLVGTHPALRDTDVQDRSCNSVTVFPPAAIPGPA